MLSENAARHSLPFLPRARYRKIYRRRISSFMTLLGVNFRGNVFVPLDHWVVKPGKEATGTQRLAIDHEFDLFRKFASALIRTVQF